jgi:endonuclease YncB( thermonuclease family)
VRGCAILALLTALAGALPAAAEAPANDAFARTWARTDRPVAKGRVSRTWMWGPEAFTGQLTEPYTESPGETRVVQYYDKSRMEITQPGGDQSSIWYVTNGLLVVELVTGKMQIGDNAFVTKSPAEVNVAGDAEDPDGPTYATFGALRERPPSPDGILLIEKVDRAGNVTEDPALFQYGVTAAQRVQIGPIDHQVASPFWAFMNSEGIIYQEGDFSTGKLFSDPFYATGYPIADAYWATVRVAGTPRDVLIQCFERRCLTYTPNNPEGWQVEAGNVGRHYYAWRHENDDGGDGGGDNPNEFTVIDVLDGDTLVIMFNERRINVRYLGIDTPEISGEEPQCYGPEAAEANRQLVMGKTVTLERDVTEADWYGNLWRYIYVDGMQVNEWLVRNGYARAISDPPDVKHEQLLAAAELDAQANARGLWGACQ